MKWRIVEERDTYTMFGTYIWFYPESRPAWWPFWSRHAQHWMYPRVIDRRFDSRQQAEDWIKDQQPVQWTRKRVVHPL